MNGDKLENIEQKLLFDGAPGAKIKISGIEYSYFGGTGYYELNNNKEVIRFAVEELKKSGITNSSSRSSYGTTQLLLDLEKEAAEFFGCEDAVYLSSGFLTDIAAVISLSNTNKFDCIFIDEISHYSNQYAAQVSGKPVYKYSHVDPDDLEKKISQYLKNGERPLVLTDGVFPIFGRIAPLKDYLRIIEKYNGILWIDDAHGLGVLGKNGRGTTEYHRLKSEKVYFGGTLSKAFGGFGGIIPGSKDFVEDIKNGQLQNGSTPPPSSAAAASLMGLKLLKAQPEMRLKLWENAKRLKSGLTQIGFETNETVVPVYAFKLGGKSEMQRIKNELMMNNIIIQFINYIGTGDDGVLRIVVFSTHTFGQIDNLIYQLKKII